MGGIQFSKFSPDSCHSVLPTFFWDVTITGSLPGMGDLSKALQFRAVSSEVPKPTHEPIMVDAMRFQFPENGIVRYNGQISITAFESNDAAIMKAIWKAYTSIFDPETGTMKAGTKCDFKVVLNIFNNMDDTQSKGILSFEMTKCILADSDAGGVLGTGAAADYFKPTFVIAFGMHKQL